MTEPNTVRVALVGMPDTGKTTFLAAFYNAVQELSRGDGIRLRCIPEQAAYLEKIRKAWLEGRKVGHTPRDRAELVRLDVQLTVAIYAGVAVFCRSRS